MSDITLTSSIRTNLSSLQSTATLLARTQDRLSTGKKVNSAIDNPTSFFTAQALNNRSSDLTDRLDGISKGIQTVKAADTGITAITSLLKQAKSVANDAKALSSTSATQDREDLMTQFNTLMKQINETVADSDYDGVNLLRSTADKLTVQFAEKMGSSTLDLQGFSANTGGATVKVGTTQTGWGAADTNIDKAIADIEDSLSNLRTESKKMAANLGVMTTRQDFIKSMVNNLTTGASNLTNADMNEESANLLALNTQQSLGVNSLSLASQASQSVLRLLQ